MTEKEKVYVGRKQTWFTKQLEQARDWAKTIPKWAREEAGLKNE